jgi:BlaI family penicillinase repressor
MKKPPRKTKNPELAEAEWDIMKVVWCEEPCAAGTVQEALQDSKGWAYSTVKTIMDRMVKKGLLEIRRIRNLQLFSSCVTEKEARQREITKTIRRAFDGALTPMMQFMLQNEKLSKKELKELRKMIDDAK